MCRFWSRMWRGRGWWLEKTSNGGSGDVHKVAGLDVHALNGPVWRPVCKGGVGFLLLLCHWKVQRFRKAVNLRLLTQVQIYDLLRSIKVENHEAKISHLSAAHLLIRAIASSAMTDACTRRKAQERDTLSCFSSSPPITKSIATAGVCEYVLHRMCR